MRGAPLQVASGAVLTLLQSSTRNTARPQKEQPHNSRGPTKTENSQHDARSAWQHTPEGPEVRTLQSPSGAPPAPSPGESLRTPRPL